MNQSVLKNAANKTMNRFLIQLMKVGVRLGYAANIAGFFTKRRMKPHIQAKIIGNYQPTAHDVFVATFLKSGTNWMVQIAHQIAHHGAAEFAHIHDVVPWPDGLMHEAISITDPAPQRRSPTGLRVIKTHLEAHYVPYDERARYLTVIRDPKEVFVSSYHFVGGILGMAGHCTMSDWSKLFLKGRVPLGALWAAHTASFWAWRERPNVLMMTFREMKRDARMAIERVADFLEVSLTEDQFEAVANRSGFTYMKQHERQFEPLVVLAKSTTPVRMMRSGKSGASGKSLGASQQTAIDDFCRKHLHALGSDFPYDEVFGTKSNDRLL